MVDPLIGRTLGGRYRIEAHLGSGGFGAVYRAVHIELGHDVAIKTLRSAPGEDDPRAERFRREARLQLHLRHPAIVRLIDFGREPDGLTYMVQELVSGRTLRAIVDTEAALPVSRAVRLAMQILDGLAAAHGNGIIHRDLKPENLMVTPTPLGEEVRILDFGLAKVLDDVDGLTENGQVMGTLAFISPEQIEQTALSPATDLYAVGGVIYYLLTGRPPFSGGHRDLLTAHLLKPVPALPPHVPPALAAVVECAMSKEPGRRYPSAVAMRAALARVMEHYTRIRAPTPAPAPVHARVEARAGQGSTAAPSLASPVTVSAEAAPLGGLPTDRQAEEVPTSLGAVALPDTPTAAAAEVAAEREEAAEAAEREEAEEAAAHEEAEETAETAASIPAPSAPPSSRPIEAPTRGSSPSESGSSEWRGMIRPPAAADRPPERRFGWLRVLVLALLVVALGVSSWLATRDVADEVSPPAEATTGSGPAEDPPVTPTSAADAAPRDPPPGGAADAGDAEESPGDAGRDPPVPERRPPVAAGEEEPARPVTGPEAPPVVKPTITDGRPPAGAAGDAADSGGAKPDPKPPPSPPKPKRRDEEQAPAPPPGAPPDVPDEPPSSSAELIAERALFDVLVRQCECAQARAALDRLRKAHPEAEFAHWEIQHRRKCVIAKCRKEAR